MKKLIFTILFLTIKLAVFCQQTNVTLTISSTKVTESSFLISVNCNIPKGWHVYAHNKDATGIEISVDDVNIQLANANYDQIPLTITDPVFDNNKMVVYEQSFTYTQLITIMGEVPASLNVTVRGFASNNKEFLPIEEVKEIRLREENNLQLTSVNIEKPINECGDTPTKNKSLLAIFLIGFGGGLIALLTPCIFPMIPVTVSYFGNKAKSKQQSIRNATLYGFFIFLIYLVASVPFHLIGNINPQIFNIISTNPWVNVFFFLVFILFALSFFGAFEIRLPSAVSNAAGSRSGIFFMALTLAIVSFSCTGIILGSLLVNALSSAGNAWELTAGMGGFGLALALPFALFAMFPQWLSKIPKSGGWLVTVKKSLAFIELALAIKFLSNADLVEHWGLLKREVFIGLWVLIALGFSMYLFNIQWFFRYGKFNISRSRIISGTLVFLFVIYLVPGLGGSNLKLLSGFPPPQSYSLITNNHKGLEPDVINDYQKAIALSKEKNRPLLIDFTGWACVNCRKMEENVWTLPEVKQLIKENYVLVSLYVDDAKFGKKWAAFQAENFKQVTQPLYVALSPEERLLNNPVGYTPSEKKYKEWLQCGIDANRLTQPSPKGEGKISKR